MMPQLLEMEGLTVTFPTRRFLFRSTPVRAVDNVWLTLDKGETLSIVGESGSGKTTLGRASLRLTPLADGRVVYDGTDISHMKERHLKWFRLRAQMVFQDPYASVDPFMNVYQLLEEPLVIHRQLDRKGRIEQALEDVQLTPTKDYVGKYPHMLSGGQRQRVGIARALMLNPEYIVADEPVSMIDASNKAEILSLMANLQNQYNIAYLYITHDIATARYFSHRTAVMYSGQVIEMTSSKDVIEEPLHPYTQALINAVPEANPGNRFIERKAVAGEPPNLSSLPTGCLFHPRCPQFIANHCDLVKPALREVKPKHFVACHLYDQT
jgi:peptide/nickel transport system ATP-binding protein